MVDSFSKLSQDEMLGDVQKNISNIIMPKKMEEEYDAMVGAEDQEERESVEKDTDDEPFDFEARKKKLEQTAPAFSPPTNLDTIEGKRRALNINTKAYADRFKRSVTSEEPLLDLAREGVRGSTTAVLEELPEVAALAVEYGAKGAYYGYHTMGNWFKDEGINATASAIEQASRGTTSLDFVKQEHDDPIDYTGVEEVTDPIVKAIRGWVQTTGKELNKTINNHIGYVPDAHKTFFTDMAYKTGNLAAPIIPFLSGANMIVRYPKLYNSIKDTSSSMIANNIKALKQTGKDSLSRGVGVFNSALGGAAAWQTAEWSFEGTKLEGYGPFAAIAGAIYGANGLSRLPLTMTFGITFAAMGKLFGSRFGEDMSEPMLRAVAISQNVPLKDIFTANREALLNKVQLTSGVHLKYIDDIANGMRALPKEYRIPLQESFKNVEALMSKYKGEKGEQLVFFLSQVTGLGIQSALVKAASTPLGLKFRPRQSGQLSDLELQQEIINKQIGIIQESMKKIINNKDLKAPENEEFLEIMQVLDKQLDIHAEQGQDVVLKIKDMSNEAHVLVNSEKKRLVDEVVEERFGYKKLEANNATPEMIEQRRVVLNNRAEEVIKNSFEKAKEINDNLYDAVAREDRLIDAESLVLMAKDAKTLAALKPLKYKGTKAGRRIESQADLIFNARMNTLELISGKALEELYGRIQRLSISNDIVFTTNKGAEFDFKTISKDIKDTLNPEARDAKIREYLADINTDDLNAFDSINKEIPPRFLLTDLLEYRSELYSMFRSKRGSAEGHAIGELIDNVDNTLDTHFGNVEDGSVIKNMYEKAKGFYKARILPFKTHLGTRMHDGVYKTDNFGDVQSVESLFAMFTRFKDPEQMGKVFEGMFQKNSDNFKEAAEIFQMTVGRILNGDIPGYKTGFINQMNLEQIAAMEKYKLITRNQFDGLKEIIKIRDEIRDSMDTVSQQAKRKTFEQEVIPELKKKIINQFGEESDLAKEIGNIKSTDDLIQKIIDEGNIKHPSLKTTGATRPLLERADETLKSIDEDLAFRFQKTLETIPKDVKSSPFTDQVLEIINKSNMDGRKKLEVLENLEKMIVYKVYKNSFSITDARSKVANISTAMRLEGESFKEYATRKWVPTEHAGLLNRLDLVAMGETMGDAFPSLAKIGDQIDATRQSLGVSAKGEKRQTTQQLKELFEIARISLAKTTALPVGQIGMSLAVSSIISRAYAIARGVVSLRFVATELFLRVHGQNKMKYITEVLTNPESVKIMHDVLVKGKTVTKEQVKYWRYVLGFLFAEKELNEIKDEDIMKSIQINMEADPDSDVRSNEKPKAVQFRSNRVKVGVPVLNTNDPPNTSFLPSPETMTKIRKAGEANRPKKFERDIGKAGMPGFTVR
tara:strand:+ start:4805 stop:8965 length:4161 start_codon:yes stop_codon:yes gene_type:complete